MPVADLAGGSRGHGAARRRILYSGAGCPIQEWSTQLESRSTDLRTMTAIWMGLTTVARERRNITLTGEQKIAATMQSWLGLSPFAVEPKRVKT
jgi:hypothetical protein